MAKTPMIENPLGGRSVKEWIGSSPDARIPDAIRDRVFIRFGGKCAISGKKLFPGEWDVDHETALADGGQHRERNLRPVFRLAHREKTAAENRARDRAERIRRKHNGTWPKSKTPLRGRGFAKTREVNPT